MHFEVNFPDDFMADLLDSDFEEIAKESLQEAAPYLEKEVKSACQSVIGDKTRTELVDSFKVWSKIVKTKTDAYMLGVSPYGKPSRKSKWVSHPSAGKMRIRNTTNNDIAWWLEKGSVHQAPKPFLDKAARNAESKILEICQKVYDKKVGIK